MKPAAMGSIGITTLVLFVLGLQGCSGTPREDAMTAAAGPTLPWVVADACPFECCRYGTWVADERLSLHAEPDSASPVLHTISTAERFDATGGHVSVTSAGRAQLTDSLRLMTEGAPGPLVPAGAELTLLQPLGEGYMQVWYEGQAWVTDLGWDQDGPAGEVIQQPVWEWWVEVAAAGDRRGWLSARGARLHSHDGCGAPNTWEDVWLETALADFASSRRVEFESLANRMEASIDLNGDLADDAIVLLRGRDWCGSGGCTMLVFTAAGQGLRHVSSTTLVRGPVRVSTTTTEGWRDLIVDVRGGGAQPTTVALRYDGRRYPSNPSVQEPLDPAVPTTGVELFELR